MYPPSHHGCSVILDLLGKRICQASETANADPHGQVLALYEPCGNVLVVGTALSETLRLRGTRLHRHKTRHNSCSIQLKRHVH